MKMGHPIRPGTENEPHGASRGCAISAPAQRQFPECSNRAVIVTPGHHPRLAPCGTHARAMHRAGYTLVFFAMLMFALMGLAALVIDIGFARLAQRQMQTAVDAAALEGLRFRDQIPDEWLNDPGTMAEIQAACGPHPALPQNPNDPSWQIWLNRVRRWAASRNVAFVFDDDLNPDNGDDGAFYDDDNPDPNAGQQFNVAGQFGAGPVLKFSDGAGSDPDLVASEFINDPTNPNSNPEIGSYPATPVYKPTRRDGTRGLELNIGDAIHGDMVAGRYIEDADHYDEDGNYIRSDFPTSMPDDSAFLVRMRRSNNFDGLDDVRNVSTHGPTVPYLFGRGSLFAVRDPEMVSDYLPRRHAMTARGTGIAGARRAKTVGVPSAALDLIGAAPFELTAAFWGTNWDEATDPDNMTPSSENDEIIIVQFDLSGSITRVGSPAQEGHRINVGSPMAIGDTTVLNSVAPAESDLPLQAYVPLVTPVEDTDGTATKRIVGFGLVTAEAADDPGTSEVEIRMRRSISRVGAENASATIAKQVYSPNIDWVAVFTQHHSVTLPLLAPASVR